VGGGEGRVPRELKTLGYWVTAIDTVAELIEAAAQADSAHDYIIADLQLSLSMTTNSVWSSPKTR
jgi:hypothetical protein